MKRTNRRLLMYGAFGAAALVVGTVAVLAYQSLQVPYQAPAVNRPIPARDCTPAPCANLQGYTLWVTNLDVQPNLVTMQVTFRNSSNSTHASPQDLLLIDSQQDSVPLFFSTPGCAPWSRHQFDHGATFGPLAVCFRVGSTAPPLILRWSPDFGFVCCQTDILLT